MKNKSKSRKRQRNAARSKHPSAPARKAHPKSNRARLIPASKSTKLSSPARERSLRALNDMRHGASISQAASSNGVTTRTIKKYVGSALLQDRPGGRIRATKSDRFVRYLQIPGLHGPVEITAHGSKEGIDAARYKAAVNRVLRGDLKAASPWQGKTIAGIELITDWRTLKSLAQKELLPYSLYRSLSGGAT